MSKKLSTQPTAEEQSIALTRDFRLIQKRKGHRYSVDDMIVAHLAGTHGASLGYPAPDQVLDLGCGLGSVLLITAWAFRSATFVGLEALEEHVAYARRNLLLNGCDQRARILAGDLRDLPLVDSLGRFPLVTGSPPYFARDTGTLCADEARAAAHFELRGGIEEYAAAARRALTPEGLFVTCAAADPPGRVEAAFAQAGLSMAYRRWVIPRPGKPPFLQLLVGSMAPVVDCVEEAPLILRQLDGHRTPEHRAIREWTGL